MFLGRYGLLFTDENGIRYSVLIEKAGEDITLFREGIKPIESNRELNDKEIEIIISKILSLKPKFQWQVK